VEECFRWEMLGLSGGSGSGEFSPTIGNGRKGMGNGRKRKVKKKTKGINKESN
jgi:hypothetical protein